MVKLFFRGIGAHGVPTVGGRFVLSFGPSLWVQIGPSFTGTAKLLMELHIGISTDNSLDFEGVVSSYFNQIWPTFRSIQGQAI